MLRTNKLLITACLLFFSLVLVAQNTNSPYSRYGYGILSDNAVGISKSMGGISSGLRSNTNINTGNPASYSNIDSLTFLFEIGITYSKGKLSDGINSENKDNGGLDYVAMMFPLTKKLGLSFGLLPYSSVGYSLGSVSTIDGIQYQTSYLGSGGLSQVYLGLGFEPIKNFSVGANAAFLFGTINHTRSIPSVSQGYPSQLYTTMLVNGLKLDFGAQYEMPISFDKKLVLGATYSPNLRVNGSFDRYRTFSGTTSSGSTSTVIDTTTITGVDLAIPATYGIGATLAKRDNWLLGADVTYQQWEDIKFDDVFGDNLTDEDRFNNKLKVSVGGEYVANPTDRNYFKRVKLRGGLNYSNSYLNVKNRDNNVGGYNEYGATIGVGLPFRDRSFTQRTSYINISLEYKNLDPKIPNMVKEQYIGVSVSVNINDLWFLKTKFR